MPEQVLGGLNLVQSQVVSLNPYADTLSQIKQLQNVLGIQLQKLKQKHQKMSQNIRDLQNQSKKQKNNQQQNRQGQADESQKVVENQDPCQKKRKQLQQVSKSIDKKQKQIEKCSLRLQLLQIGRTLTNLPPSRLDQLQKIFNHYCHYIFKSGKHVTFDRIVYQKEHLIMQRFFAFIHDFHLNKYHDSTKGAQRQLIPKHQLILIFKKSSANSRNLEFSEFITCLEKLAVVRYEFEQTYDKRKAKEQAERRKIRQINARRQNERQGRLKKKQQEERQKLEQERLKAQEEERRRQQQELKNSQNQQPQEQNKSQKKQKKKKDKQKKKKKKTSKPEESNNDNQSQSPDFRQKSESNNNQNENNDQMLNQLMKKDSSIQNPNQQFQKLNKFKKGQARNAFDPRNQNLQQLRRAQLLTLLKQQKVQLLYRLMQLDNSRTVQQKLRAYEKPMYKVLAEQRKHDILNSSSVSKLRQTDMNHGLRLGQLKEKVNERKSEKLKRSMTKSISDEKYIQKKNQGYQKYLDRAIAIKNKQDADAIEQQTTNRYQKKNQPVSLSLNMLNQTSQDGLNRLKLGSNLKKYLYPQEEDKVYLKQYGGLQRYKSVNSTYLQKSPRLSVDIKKRAQQVQQAEKKNSQQKLQRFALQMYKNQHYMKRFMQRKI